MNAFALAIPALFMAVFLVAAIRKVRIYDAFTAGMGKAIPFIISVFPYLAAIFLLTELFEQSGLSDLLCRAVSPAFGFFGVPEPLIKLLLIKPFSGSGATAVFSEIVLSFGADSYIARCAAAVYGSSETVFYIGAVYFANVREKKLLRGVIISLVSCFLSAVLACLLCRIL